MPIASRPAESAQGGGDSDVGPARHSRPSSAEPSDPLFANLDPALHPATLNSVSSENENPLTHFAQHVLGDHEGSLLGFNVGGSEDSSLFTATGEARFGELLEAADREQRTETATNGSGGGGGSGAGNGGGGGSTDNVRGTAFHFDVQTEPGQVDHQHQHHPGGGPPPPPPGGGGDGKEESIKMGRVVARGKRRRGEGEEIIVGPVENGEPIDPIKMKKDSHKEVERRRRENINDGINDIAKYVPGGQDKMGKGLLLRRAADYLADLTTKMARVEDDMAARDREKLELQNELVQAQARLAEEHSRSMRFETSWREAEDRVASSQFELDRLKTELEDLKQRLVKHEGE